MDVTLSSSPAFRNLPVPLQQHPQYGAAVRHLGGQADWVLWSERGHPVAQAQRLTRRIGPLTVSWLPRGPVQPPHSTASHADLFTSLRNAIPAPILITPDCNDKAPSRIPLFTRQYVAELDLSQSQDQRLTRQHGKWRNRLRKAQTRPLCFRQCDFDPERHDHLLRLEQVQRRCRGYTALPPAFLTAWSKQAHKTTCVTTAHLNGQMIAFMIFLLHAPVATYHIGWAGPLGRENCAHHRLLWEAANHLCKKGYTRLDLGVVSTDTAPGLARFKIGSGASVRSLGATYLGLPGFFPRSALRKRAFPLANRSTPG